MVRWRFQSFPLQWISFFCLVPVLLTHANDSGHSLSLSQPTEATVERNKIVISGSTPTEVSIPIQLKKEDPSRALVYFTDNELENCTNCRVPAGIYFKISQNVTT